MDIKMIIFIIMMAIFTSHAMAGTNIQEQNLSQYDPADLEMINALLMREEQIDAYINVIKAQRTAFLALNEGEWQKKMDVYENTIEMLKPVLDEKQLAQFTALTGCLIEQARHYSHLSIE